MALDELFGMVVLLSRRRRGGDPQTRREKASRSTENRDRRKWLNRRAFLQGGTLFLAGSALLRNETAAEEGVEPQLRG